MEQAHQKACLEALVEAALVTLPTLQSELRADCYDGIWVACERVAPDLAKAAKATADIIREADQRQLLFKHLLKGEGDA